MNFREFSFFVVEELPSENVRCKWGNVMLGGRKHLRKVGLYRSLKALGYSSSLVPIVKLVSVDVVE
jgi:hypothetical protein